MADWAVKTAFTAVDKVSPAFNQMSGASAKFGAAASQNIGVVNKSLMALKGMLPVIGAAMIGAFVNSTVEVAVKMERLATGFKAVFEGDATRQMEFVRTETKRLGLEFTTTADAYKSISAAAKGSAIDNKMVQQVFLGVAEAATSLQLSSDESEGALRALSQMISKGKVQAEELRGQLGERLPGAFQIAARSMGMTTAQLDKFMSDGKLTAELFIPKFAAQMRKEFGGSAKDAAKSFSASSNRFTNLTTEMKVGIGTTLLPALNDLMSAFVPIVEGIASWSRANRETISYIIQKAVPVLLTLIGLFVAWKIALIAVKTVQMGMNLVGWVRYLWMMRDAIGAAVVRTNAWAVAQRVINFLLSMNPIGLVIMAVGALIFIIKDLYTNWEIYALSFNIWIQDFITGFRYAKMEVYELLNLLGLITDKELTGAKLGYLQSFSEGNKMKLDMIQKQKQAPNAAEAEGKYMNNIGITVNNNGTQSSIETTPRGVAKADLVNAGVNI